MTKIELAGYLSNLISIMVSKETASLPRGRTLGDEYNKHYQMLIDILHKENDDGQRSKS